MRRGPDFAGCTQKVHISTVRIAGEQYYEAHMFHSGQPFSLVYYDIHHTTSQASIFKENEVHHASALIVAYVARGLEQH